MSRAATPDAEISEVRDRLDRRLGGPARFDPPEKWTLSGSWKRAQAGPSIVGTVTPAEFDVLLGYPDSDGYGDRHRVLFAILDGELRAECDCAAHRFRGWCAHVAHLWWQWAALGDLGVTDLNTERTHLHPPAWLSVGGER